MSTLKNLRMHYDVVVVGARCAGAALAMLLARAGAKVLVIDRHGYGTDTVSTHALMRTGVYQLNEWGLLPAIMASGTPALRQTTFHYGRESVRVDIQPEHGIDYLCAPRRTVLDSLLVDAAWNAGADMRHGVSLIDLQYGADNRVVGAWLKDQEGRRISVACDLLVGADGRQSTVAKLVDAQAYLKGANSSGYIFGYYTNLNREGLHWHFCRGFAAGTIPTNGGHHCVFASMPGQNFAVEIRGGVEDAFLRILEMNSPELRGDVERARLQGRLKGFAGGPGYIKQAHGAGWALVGDAGHFKDPLTAHGITDALRDAELLARAVLEARSSAMTHYQHVRDALSREFFFLTEEIASFDWDLEEIRALHKRLSASMRAECDYMANNGPLRNLAA